MLPKYSNEVWGGYCCAIMGVVWYLMQYQAGILDVRPLHMPYMYLLNVYCNVPFDIVIFLVHVIELGSIENLCGISHPRVYYLCCLII